MGKKVWSFILKQNQIIDTIIPVLEEGRYKTYLNPFYVLFQYNNRW